MLSLEDHALLESNSHPGSVLGALTTHKTTPVQPPADLQPEKRSLNLLRWMSVTTEVLYTREYDDLVPTKEKDMKTRLGKCRTCAHNQHGKCDSLLS